MRLNACNGIIKTHLKTSARSSLGSWCCCSCVRRWDLADTLAPYLLASLFFSNARICIAAQTNLSQNQGVKQHWPVHGQQTRFTRMYGYFLHRLLEMWIQSLGPLSSIVVKMPCMHTEKHCSSCITHSVWRDKMRVVEKNWSAKAAAKDLDGVQTYTRPHLHKGGTVCWCLLLIQPRNNLQSPCCNPFAVILLHMLTTGYMWYCCNEKQSAA